MRNSAQREVTDVLQVYLHDATGVVLRPDRELAAFAKLRLAPGEQRTVELAVPARAFAFYDVVQQGMAEKFGPEMQRTKGKAFYDKIIQLPFVMGVMSDLSGKPEEALAPVADRKFLEIDVDNFDDRMKSMAPRAAFTVPNTLTGEGNLAVDITARGPTRARAAHLSELFFRDSLADTRPWHSESRCLRAPPQ